MLYEQCVSNDCGPGWIHESSLGTRTRIIGPGVDPVQLFWDQTTSLAGASIGVHQALVIKFISLLIIQHIDMYLREKTQKIVISTVMFMFPPFRSTRFRYQSGFCGGSGQMIAKCMGLWSRAWVSSSWKQKQKLFIIIISRLVKVLGAGPHESNRSNSTCFAMSSNK